MLTCRRTSPPAHLAGLVDCIWELDGEWRGGIDHLLPDVGVDIVTRVEGTIAVFRDEGWTRLPDRAVIGSLGRAIPLQQSGRLHIVGIRLTPAHASVLRVRASELRNRILPLGEVAPHLDAAIGDFALALTDGRAMVADLFGVFEGRQPIRSDATVLFAARQLSRGASIRDVAARVGLSPRHLHRRFVGEVGWTPSAFRRLARFGRVSAMAAATPALRWAELAARAGYFDQAHLARDFQLFAGRAATSLFSDAWHANYQPSPHTSDPYKRRPPSR